MEKVTIISPNGGKVNMRAQPRLGAALVCQLDPGTEVETLGTVNTGWTHCRYEGKTGYVMSQYLSTTDGDGAYRAQIAQAESLLREALGILEGIK